jgi:hypothetical protein
MWYEAVPDGNKSKVGYATSSDGKTWTKRGSVLSPSEPWEGGSNGEISPNTILIENGVYKMWYHSFGNDQKRRIGYATSPNGINWTKHPTPVLGLGSAGSFDDYFVTEPRVFNLGNGQYRMYYGAVRQSQQGIGVYRLMTATSSDGINWTKQNQVIFGPYDSGYAIVRDGNQWHMWYGLAYNGLAYASSTDGLNWTPGSNNPVLNWNSDLAAPDSQGVGDSVSAYKDGNEFRIMYTGGRYNSFGRNESICLATITVAAECNYTLSSLSQNISADGGNGSINVTATNECSWTAVSNSSWITVTTGAGTGNGTFSFAVQQNPGHARSGTISVGGQTFTVNQSATTQPVTARPYFDFDGDGKSDVSVYRPEDGFWHLLNTTLGYNSNQFGISTDVVAPADYDGDGKTDLGVFRDGVWHLKRSTQGNLTVNFGTPGDIPQPADFDGDGTSELAVYRPSDGTWYTFNLTNNQVSSAKFGLETDKPVVGDYDGDGRADYAVYRPESSVWYLLKSSEGFTAIRFGISTDQLVAQDFDGDGKTDIAVYRDGVWYQLRSTEGIFIQKFGLPTDIPVPADYDGDGQSDIAVYRNGLWYLYRSSQGFTVATFGLSTDKPIPSVFVK